MDYLRNVTEGVAFVETKEGLIAISPNETIDAKKVTNVGRLLEIGFFDLFEDVKVEEKPAVAEVEEKPAVA